MVAVRRLFTMSWSRCARRGVRVRRTRKQKRKSTCRARNRGGKKERVVPGPAMIHRRFGGAGGAGFEQKRAITPRQVRKEGAASRSKKRAARRAKTAPF